MTFSTKHLMCGLVLASSAFVSTELWAWGPSFGVTFKIKNDTYKPILVHRPVFKNKATEVFSYQKTPSKAGGGSVKLDFDGYNENWVWGDGPKAIKEDVIVEALATRVANNQEYSNWYSAPYHSYTANMVYETEATITYAVEQKEQSCKIMFVFFIANDWANGAEVRYFAIGPLKRMENSGYPLPNEFPLTPPEIMEGNCTVSVPVKAQPKAKPNDPDKEEPGQLNDFGFMPVPGSPLKNVNSVTIHLPPLNPQ